MKKICVLLFTIVVLGMTGCATNSVGTPICPDWARPDLGDYCETGSRSIYPPDSVALLTWEVAQIQLRNTVIVRSQGVIFYTEGGVQVKPDELKEGEFYTIKKTENTGAIWFSVVDPNKISPSTHLNLAKP